MNWDSLADQYWALVNGPTQGANESLRRLLGKAASVLPKDKAEELQWFISALQEKPKKWFVAKVMEYASPVPKALLEPLLLAALREPDASSNRIFVTPCLRTFGKQEVKDRLVFLASDSVAQENDGLRKVMYWVEQTDA